MKNGNRQSNRAESHWGLLALIAGSAMLGVMGTVAILTVLEANRTPKEVERGAMNEALRTMQTDALRIRANLANLRELRLEATEAVRAGTIVVSGASRGNRTARAMISVRGSSDGRPIVYVDDVRMDDSSEGLSSLSPDRIDRVEIIKGEAAREQYGEEAANGVVQVFLKKSGDDADGEGKRRRRPSHDSR